MNEYYVTQLSIKYFKDFDFMDVNCNKKNGSVVCLKLLFYRESFLETWTFYVLLLSKLPLVCIT